MRALTPRSVVPVLAALALLGPAVDGAAQQQTPRAPGERGWIGISFTYEGRCAECADTADARSIVVKDVFEGSPAERAGLRRGDVLVAVDGRRMEPQSLARFGNRLRPGQEVGLSVRRDGVVRTVELVAGERPTLAEAPVPPEVVAHLDSVRSALIRRFDSLRAGIRPLPPFPGAPGVERARRAPVPDSLRLRLRSLQEELLDTWREQRELAAAARRSRRELAEEERERLRELRRRADTVQGELQELYATIAADAARSAARAMERMERGAERERMEREEPAETPGGRDRRVRVEVAPRPPNPHLLGRSYIAGARVTTLNAGLSDYFGVERGVLVTEVLDASPAQEAGLQAGDVILSVDEGATASVDALRRSLARASSWPVTLRVVRKGEEMAVRLGR